MSPGTTTIKSEVLLTVVMTRAHTMAVMADPRVGHTAKMISLFLWGATETWGPGSEVKITMGQIASAIIDSKGPLSERTVQRAIKELEEAGYITIDRAEQAGRGATPTIKMIRRRYGDVGTTAESGPARVWTKEQMAESKAHLSVVPDDPDDLEDSQPIEDGAASNDSLEGAFTWDDIITPAGFLAMLDRQVGSDSVARKELTSRKRQEISEQLAISLQQFSLPIVTFGLGFWMGDRQLANAPILADRVARAAVEFELEHDALATESPEAVLCTGYDEGVKSRRARLDVRRADLRDARERRSHG